MERMNVNDAMDLERECELWDWVRTAGVSAEALKAWLLNPPLASSLPPSQGGRTEDKKAA
jgi:hypothetical protein